MQYSRKITENVSRVIPDCILCIFTPFCNLKQYFHDFVIPYKTLRERP
eukprot:UN23199